MDTSKTMDILRKPLGSNLCSCSCYFPSTWPIIKQEVSFSSFAKPLFFFYFYFFCLWKKNYLCHLVPIFISVKEISRSANKMKNYLMTQFYRKDGSKFIQSAMDVLNIKCLFNKLIKSLKWDNHFTLSNDT